MPLTNKRKRTDITEYLYKKLLVSTSSEVHSRLNDNGTKISLKECRKQVNQLLKKQYKIIDK